MKLRLIMALVMMLLLYTTPGWASGDVLGRIAVDPGHGGYDPGATRQGVMEKDVNLQISQEIAKLLKQNNVEVVLTRDGDYNLAVEGLHKKEAKRYDFDKRIELAKRAKADAMVSIHVNISRRKCSGPEAFYFKKSAQGKMLAEIIQKELYQIPGINHRAVKTGRYYLITHTDMPCVIVETGFLNNPEEREKLTDKKYQLIMAEAITKGIINYLKIKDQPQSGNIKVLDYIKNLVANIQKR
ncbi:cell wall hydrolase/autolysin [Desulforamulus reducens MI-1]|uniref:Cell wall hydrolase/autolysin n=1 Tax=Desulforamulus reducens (strain ATCC BAA-1160 / DSM 100696 / MI-1) TaxID=349161 RepID=A4J4V3_DESRM|nr:N-acetylmuramoyl-L-alanine amidase [Desulforamulus reducens]ABO50106.1 cell wall hydrolase/autolysin [Desulforamulus reducens MI-1]